MFQVFFPTRLHFDALAARSGKGRSREKREKKEKALIQRKTRSAYLSLSLLCLAFTAVSSSSSLSTLRGINVGICGGITQQGFVSSWKFFSKFSFWPCLFFSGIVRFYLRKQRKNATQTTFQFLQQSFYFDLLKTCPTSYLYFICERLKKFHPKQIFPWKRPSLMRCRSSDVSAEEFCQFWQKKKKSGGQNKDQAPMKTCNASS